MINLSSLEAIYGAQRLGTVVGRFAKSLVDDLALLTEAHASGDLFGTAQAAHRLKGAALALGAEPLARASGQMETAANGADTVTVEAELPLLVKLTEEVARLVAARATA